MALVVQLADGLAARSTPPPTKSDPENMNNGDSALQQESLGRILVVDDNRDNVEIIATRLRFRGYEIDEASDGATALEMVRNNPPDLMLLDVMLPDIDGYEIARR